MNFTSRISVIAGFAAALAAPTSWAADDPDQERPRRWGLGAAVVVTDSPYAGEGARVTPIPLVTYEGEKFFFQGITAGWRFVSTDSWTIAAIAKGRLDGFDIDDLGRAELAQNGLDYSLLEDRDDGLDAGALVEWEGSIGEVSLEVVGDVTSASKGMLASLVYGYPVQFGQLRITPNTGVRWLSKKSANYYYGTLDEEIARGAVDYRPGSASVFHVGVGVARPFGERWLVLGSVEYRMLPNEIKRSPLIEAGRDDEISVMVGFARSF